MLDVQRTARALSMAGYYQSLSLNSTSTLQQTFPILATDVNQPGRLIITQWGNGLDSVDVTYCFYAGLVCTIQTLSPSYPSLSFALWRAGDTMEIRMSTQSSKQGFVAYRIL